MPPKSETLSSLRSQALPGATAAAFTPFTWVADCEQAPNTQTLAAIAIKQHSERGILISPSREFVGIPFYRTASPQRTRHPRRRDLRRLGLRHQKIPIPWQTGVTPAEETTVF